jgi:hypothetical protein
LERLSTVLYTNVQKTVWPTTQNIYKRVTLYGTSVVRLSFGLKE